MKAIEVIPQALLLLSKGNSLSADEIANMGLDITARSVTNSLNIVKTHFLDKDIYYDASTHRWCGKAGFLNNYTLSAEELVIASAILSNENHFGESLTPTLSPLIKRLEKRSSSVLFRERTLERIGSRSMQLKFSLLRSAIKNNRKIKFIFSNTIRNVHPFQFFNKEYYWYLAGYEEEKIDPVTNTILEKALRMKTYTIAHISDIEIMEEEATYNFGDAGKKIEYATNGYIDWDNDIKQVDLLVKNSIIDHLDRAMFYRRWKKIMPSVAHPNYHIYKAYSVAENYKDIIPIILKHSPLIHVIQPDDLKQQIYDHLEAHKKEIDKIG